MASQSRSEFDNFKASINPVSVIKNYVELRKQGSQWVGRCPFHDDGRPSLSVNERGWKCFGCDAKGDAVRFVQDQVVRIEPGSHGRKKDFRQRRPDGRGGWIWKVRDGDKDLVRHVLYRLPKVIQARRLCIACGEKDVHTLEAMGLVATTNPGGEGKWRKEYNKHLEGKEIVAFPDNDSTGMRHAELLQRELKGVYKSFSICTVLL